MQQIDEKNITLEELNFINFLKKCTNTRFYVQPYRLQWKPDHNLLVSSFANKKCFNDMFSSFHLLNNSKISYKGNWFKTFTNIPITASVNKTWFNTSTYNRLKNNKRPEYLLDNISPNPTKSKTNAYSLVFAQFKEPDKAIVWLLHWDPTLKNGMYNVFKKDINLEHFSWYNYFPYYLNIDSEYVDKVMDNTGPYENKRDRYPVSITATSINVFTSKKRTHHYIFNPYYYNRLQPYKQNDDMAISHYDEKLSLCRNEHYPYLLTEKTPFFCFLYQIYLNVYPNLTYQECLLYLCPESYTRSEKGFKKNGNIIYINFFWSAKDLRYWFGYVGYMYMEPFLDTKNNSVTFDKFKIKSRFGFLFKVKNIDLYIILQLNNLSKLSEKGLQDLANVTNVPLTKKQEVDKTDITNTLKSDPELYLEYCRQDTENLDVMAHNSYMNLLEMYEMFNIKNIPSFIDFSPSNQNLNYMRYTSGSNCSKFFEEYIYSLDSSMKHTLDLLSIRAGDNTQIDGINMGSRRYLNFLGSHATIGAFVAGGRTVSERIEKNYSNGADIDLSSAYSNSLKSQMYCVGIPSVVRPIQDTFQDDDGIIKYFEPFIGNLRDVLKTYRKNFIPGCWIMIISTKEPLSFYFDLIISKNISQPTKYDPETTTNNSTVPGEQFILLHEIKNGVLANSSLEIIDKIATRSEKKELYEKIYVKEIIYYDKRHQCKTPEEFNLKVCCWYTLKDEKKRKRRKGRPRLNKDTVGIGSKKEKPPFWYGVKMDSFMSKLIDLRKHYQQLYKKTKDPIYESKQRSIKNFSNMLYGSIASKHFNISNIVAANNITELCRSAVYIKGKALNLTQTVTDGGTIELNRVNYYHQYSLKHKPGFHVLTYNTIHQNSSFIKPLGYSFKIFWDTHLKKTANNEIYREKLCKIIDKFVNRHVIDFLNYYDLNKSTVFPYNIETKRDNLFFKCTNVGRGHYALQRTDNSFLFKVRGTQQKEGYEHIKSPIFEMLKAKMFDQDTLINNLTYTKSILVKSHDLKRIREKDPSIKLHDAYVQLMCIRVKCDSGKYAYYENFLRSTRKTFEKQHYSFLDPKFFNTNSNPCVLSSDYWSYYHNTLYNECLTKLDNNKISKRFSKSSKEEFFELVENANKCDPNFKHAFSNHLNSNYNGEIKSENSSSNASDDCTNSTDEIPFLTDDENDNQIFNFLRNDFFPEK